MLLIVDDNNNVRRMIRSLVADLDADIFECADGGEAISACRERRPDWVLMDVNMRPIDGLTATRQIKKTFPEIRVVIVTDHADPKTRLAAFAAGANGFFGKENLLRLRDLIICGNAGL